MEVRDRFYRKVEKTDDCWNWIGARLPAGYGKFLYNGRGELAHRASYMMHVGDIPEGMLICHHCDNPSCVNPDHLFVGSYKDNNNDRALKGRTRGWWSNPEAIHPNKGRPSGKKGSTWTEARRAKGNPSRSNRGA